MLVRGVIPGRSDRVKPTRGVVPGGIVFNAGLGMVLGRIVARRRADTGRSSGKTAQPASMPARGLCRAEED
jgi:hypothetical protein